MNQVAGKDLMLEYIENLVHSFNISLLDISNKFYNDYNYEAEKEGEITIIGIKGHLRSRQEEDMVVSTMWFEYSILKEPYSGRKEAHEVQWHTILDQELSHKCTIRQLEKIFDVIKKKIDQFDIFRPEHPIERQYCDPDEIEVHVKVGSKYYCRSSK